MICEALKANVYFTSKYINREKKVTTTKHHFFLNNPYKIKYIDTQFILTLKKIEKNNVLTVDAETYLREKKGPVFVAGKKWINSANTPMKLVHDNFSLEIIFEKILP